MSWKEKLHEEVINDIEALGGLELASDEFNAVVPKVNDMIDRLNEAERIEVEREKLKADKRDRLIKNILTGVTFVGGAAVTIWGTLYSDNFDAEKIRGNEAGKTHIRNWLGFMKKN